MSFQYHEQPAWAEPDSERRLPAGAKEARVELASLEKTVEA
jgi:hypothetical protein